LTQFSDASRLAPSAQAEHRLTRRDQGKTALLNGHPNEEHRRRTRVSQIAQAYRAAHEVVSAAFSLGLLVLGGNWLDQKYGWTPAFTVVGAVVGFVVAGVSLAKLLRRLDQESARKKQEIVKKGKANSE
jgi:F0F1-type ATP synthase assembly protein I